MKKPAAPSALLLRLGLKLFPVNMQCMLNKDLTQFIQFFSQVCQIQGNKRTLFSECGNVPQLKKNQKKFRLDWELNPDLCNDGHRKGRFNFLKLIGKTLNNHF